MVPTPQHRDPAAEDGCLIDREFDVPGLNLQMRTYLWPSHFEDRQATQGHTAMLTLSPQPPETLGRFCLNDATGNFAEIGRVTFTPAHVPIHWRTKGGELRILCCEVDDAHFRSIGEVEKWTEQKLLAGLNIGSDQLRRILARMADEIKLPGFAASFLLEALGVELIIELSRYFRQFPDGGPQINYRETDILTIAELTDYIDRLECPVPSLNDLAELCGVSRGHLIRSFKAQTGTTVHRYIEHVRLRRAKDYLTEGDLPLKEIAFRLGLANPAHFSCAFRKLAGEAPGSFRKRTRRGRD
jgi:AraC family transcriptional regulator